MATETVDLIKKQLQSTTRLQNLSILRDVTALEDTAQRFLVDIMNKYSKLVEEKRRSVRLVSAQQQRDTKDKLQHMERLYELKKFAFHVSLGIVRNSFVLP